MFSPVLSTFTTDSSTFTDATSIIKEAFEQSPNSAGITFQSQVLFLRDSDGDLFTVTEAGLDRAGSIHVLGRKQSAPLQWDVSTGGYLDTDCTQA